MSAFFMGFLDKSKRISLATISLFSSMLRFVNQTGMLVLEIISITKSTSICQCMILIQVIKIGNI